MSGGSSDTELNELIVIPRGSPWRPKAVMTVIPVAKLPRVRRKSRQFRSGLRASSFFGAFPTSHVAQGRSAVTVGVSGQFAAAFVGVIGGSEAGFGGMLRSALFGEVQE